MRRGGFTYNPLSPHDASKHHVASLKNAFFKSDVKPRDCTTKIVMELFNNNNILFLFATHFKSSLSTTSRELRKQFAACSR